MNLSLNNFNLLKEDSDCYHIAHPKGKTLIVEKKGLSSAAKKAIEGMKKKYYQGTDEGPVESENATLSVPNSIALNPKDEVAMLPSVKDNLLNVDPTLKNVLPEDVGQAETSKTNWQPSDITDFSDKLLEKDSKAQLQNQKSITSPISDAEQDKLDQQNQNNSPLATTALNDQNVYDPTLIYKAQKDANIALGNLEAAKAKEQADAIDTFLNQNEKGNDLAEINKKIEDERLAMRAENEKGINPNRYWENLGTGGRIQAGIALLLGGIGAGIGGGENMALKMIEKNIDRDIDAQKASSAKQENLYKLNLQALGDERLAAIATKQQQIDLVKMQIEKAAVKNGGFEAIQKAKILNSQIEQEQQKLGFQRSILTKGLGLGLPNGTLDSSDPAQLVNYSPATEKEKEDARKAIQESQTIKRNARDILKNYDDYLDSSLGSKMLGSADLARKKAAILVQIGQTIKPIEGANRESLFSSIEKNLFGSTPTDPEGRATLRKALFGYLNNSSQSAIAKGAGIDIDKFRSTAPFTNLPVGEAVPDRKIRRLIYDSPKFITAEEARNILKARGEIPSNYKLPNEVRHLGQ